MVGPMARIAVLAALVLALAACGGSDGMPAAEPETTTTEEAETTTSEEAEPTTTEEEEPTTEAAAERPGKDFIGLVATMRKIEGADPEHNDWVFVEWARESADEPFTELASGQV